MKQDIHPEYKKTTITCACGAQHEVSSTKEDIDVEICSNCHPFYTGEEDLVDTAGRAEKFEARREKAKQAQDEQEEQQEEHENEEDEPEEEDETEKLAKEAEEKLEK